MLTFQQIILKLQAYWADQGCALLQPYDMEVGAGTSHTATFLRALGPEPWKAAYVQPSRRPKDGRYGENPNRLQHYYQFQVVLKPAPLDVLELYIGSLGTLCVIVEATFKLRPSPQTREGLDFEFESVETACGFVLRLEQHGLPIQAAVVSKLEIMDGSDFIVVGGYRVNVDIAGTFAAVPAKLEVFGSDGPNVSGAESTTMFMKYEGQFFNLATIASPEKSVRVSKSGEPWKLYAP
jgi:hypothetical protein